MRSSATDTTAHDHLEVVPPPLQPLGGDHSETSATTADSSSSELTNLATAPQSPFGNGRLSSSGDNSKNKKTKKKGSSSKLRRVSLLAEDVEPSTTTATKTRTRPRRCLSITNDVPSESDVPVVIDYSEGLPTILFNGNLMSDDTDRVIQATITLQSILRGGGGKQKNNGVAGDSEAAKNAARQFVSLGGHALLVTVMKKWQTHPIIQYRLCACMADFTYHYQNSSPTTSNSRRRRSSSSSNNHHQLDIFKALVEMGGMDLVVGAMKRYAKVESFQYTCMLIIGNLCSDDVSGSVADRFVNNLEGIHLICKAMKQFPDKQAIQQTGTWLLEVLCSSGMSQAGDMIVEALALVATAVRTYPNNHDLANDARSFMKQVWEVK